MLDTQPHEKKDAIQYVDVVICKKCGKVFNKRIDFNDHFKKLHVYTLTHLQNMC